MSPSHSGDFCQGHSPFSSVSLGPTLLTLVLACCPSLPTSPPTWTRCSTLTLGLTLVQASLGLWMR